MLFSNDSNQFDRLRRIIKTLRSEDGCPWDRKQTPETIIKYLIEETQELAEALSKGDIGQICEETGDLFFILLLIIAMHSEKDHFNSHKVLSSICEKMIRRHPHVFSNISVTNEVELRAQWERIKRNEKESQKRKSSS